MLLRLVYPGRCKGCGGALGRGEKHFCLACLGRVNRIDGALCTYCGLPFPHGSGGDHPCSGCMERRPPFTSARAPLVYEGVIKEAIHLYKYRQFRSLKGYLGGFIEEGAQKFFPDATVAVPVPLHKRRLRHRGFNQSLFLAERVARSLGIKLSLDGLERIRYTKPQVELKPEDREKNVRGAFEVSRPEDFKAERVLLVDDVYTTGATVRECARVLTALGAEAVYILTVARVIKE
ncbi:MAG: ComF family protein [Nitrospirota bacterium]